MSVAHLAQRCDQQSLYDARYAAGYMDGFTHLYEVTRRRAVGSVLRDLVREGCRPATVLDYGCGVGRWLALIREAFPKASITGCDISRVALSLGRDRCSTARFVEMTDEHVPLPDESLDLITCIEVLEHVADVERAMNEIGRLLRPDGLMIASTPCANRWSLEWSINRLTGGLQKSADGYLRFATDESGHLRRLGDFDLWSLLDGAGLTQQRIYHGAHLFTTLATAPEAIRGYQRIPIRVRAAFAMLDWRLLKNRSNGATMIVVAARRPAVRPSPAKRDRPVLARQADAER